MSALETLKELVKFSVLYSLLIDHLGRWLGAAGTVGTLSLSQPRARICGGRRLS